MQKILSKIQTKTQNQEHEVIVLKEQQLGLLLKKDEYKEYKGKLEQANTRLVELETFLHKIEHENKQLVTTQFDLRAKLL